jgi:hypothetical protein
LAGTPDTLTRVSLGFPQSLKENSGIVARLGHGGSLLNIFQIINHPEFERYIGITQTV